jgi:multiple sugar transport system permease protein
MGGELVLELPGTRFQPPLARVDHVGVLEGVFRADVGAVDLEDAARIDGAGPWRIFTRIILPLSQPVLGALAIFAFRSAWNDFLWPLIAVNKPEMFPLPVALALLRSAYSSESYGPIMAGATLSALPLLIVFLVANRRIVEGVRVSGVKG